MPGTLLFVPGWCGTPHEQDRVVFRHLTKDQACQENAPIHSMESLPGNPSSICRERILNVSRRQDSTRCVLANHSEARLPLLLASHIAIGDEIMFSIPDGHAAGAEVYL